MIKAEVINQYEKKWLRVYVEPDSLDGATVNNLGQLSFNGSMDSWTSEFDKSTGSMKWFEIPVPKGDKSVEVTIQQVYVQVKGPWKMDLPVTSGF